MAIRSIDNSSVAIENARIGLASSFDKSLTFPEALVDWLARLRLLEGVPFGYLVPHDEMLPPESIRFFYINRNWTDAIVDGALSVGAISSRDFTHLHRLHANLRIEIDKAERRIRDRVLSHRDTTGSAEVMTGFLLRSKAVSGWPGLHITARRETANKKPEDWDAMRLLRIERLSPAVLLVLVDGIPDRVEIEEPRQGVQFGVDPATEHRSGFTLKVKQQDGGEPTDKRVDIPFRANSPGVIDVITLNERLFSEVKGSSTGSTGLLNSAEFAQQMMQFPFRQPFEAMQVSEADVFKANIELSEIQPDDVDEGGN